MSKTDKTKPYWVRMKEHRLTEVHDHRSGVCDLKPITGNSSVWWSGDCGYDYWWFGCCTGCGCAMCTSRHWRRQSRRKSRHNAKAAIRRRDYDRLSSNERERWSY